MGNKTKNIAYYNGGKPAYLPNIQHSFSIHTRYKQNISIIQMVFETFYYKIKRFPKISHSFPHWKTSKKQSTTITMV